MENNNFGKKMDKKDIIIIALIVVIIVLIIVLAFNLIGGNKKNTNTITNNGNNKVNNVAPEQKNTTATVDSFDFSLVNTTFENGTSTFEVNITNKSAATEYLNEFAILVKDAEGNEMVKLYGVVDSDINAGETTTISCSYGGDLSGYASLEFVIEK